MSRILSSCLLIALVALVPGAGVSSAAAQSAGTREILIALRDVDMRLARIGERLAVANAALCRDREARTGMVLHDLAQYSPAVRVEALATFGFSGPVAVEGVVPESAAERAGIRPNDVIARLDGSPLGIPAPDTSTPVGTDRLVEAYNKLAAAGTDGRVEVGVVRDDTPLTIMMIPDQACASRFEVVMRNGFDALADGTIVQLSTKMIEAVESDDELAAVVAHELAHNILRHRARLKSAGVERGIMESLGRAVGYIRRSEIEADLLGIALLANAGYDVSAPARFWRWFGRRHYNSILLSRTHPKWSTRAKLFDREAATIASQTARPYIPPILAERDKPMSNDWQALLAGL